MWRVEISFYSKGAAAELESFSVRESGTLSRITRSNACKVLGDELGSGSQGTLLLIACGASKSLNIGTLGLPWLDSLLDSR